MKRIIKYACFFAALLLLGCGKDDHSDINREDFVSLYGGKPFKGTAIGLLSEAGQTTYTWNGEGRIALIEATTDSVSLVFIADFDDEGEINFKVRGAYDGTQYSTGRDQSSYFNVQDQQIDGLIINEDQRMTFQGKMEKEKATLNMRVEFLKETGSFPQGSLLDLTFETTREIVAGDEDGEGCQMRLVPIWSPSGVTMGMVPDC